MIARGKTVWGPYNYILGDMMPIKSRLRDRLYAGPVIRIHSICLSVCCRPPFRYRPFTYELCRSPYGSWSASYELCRSSYELWSAPYEHCRATYQQRRRSSESCRSAYESRRRVNKSFPPLSEQRRRPADIAAAIRIVPTLEPTFAIKKKGERPFAPSRNQFSLFHFNASAIIGSIFNPGRVFRLGGTSPAGCTSALRQSGCLSRPG